MGVEAAHELPRIDHREPKADQHDSESGAERDDQEEAEGDAMDRKRSEEHYQRRWAWHDAAGDAECEEALERDAFRGGSVIIGMDMCCGG